MSEWDRQQQGRRYEGWAFTFCKAAFLVLLLGRNALLVLSGLATLFYILAAAKGVREWRCWAKPPWVTIFWGVVFISLVADRLGLLPNFATLARRALPL